MHKQNKNEKDRIEAGSYIWNSIGGMLNAGQSVLILMVITRVSGLTAAGIFSIAFATGNLLMNFGNYGVRNYQVSDLREQYSFRGYLAHRFVTVGLMILAAVIWCVYDYSSGAYSLYKTLVVLAMCLLKAVDCIEEVFEGRLQQEGRLDQAGKLVTFRLCVSIGGMLLVLVLVQDLLVSTVAAIILAAAAASAMIWHYRRTLTEKIPYAHETESANWAEITVDNAESRKDDPRHRKDLWKDKLQDNAASAYTDGNMTRAIRANAANKPPFAAQIRGLMRSCFPVCAGNLLSFYLINAPKYSIDAILDETAQARYNFIAMPVFVIQLMNMFLYQPVLGKMTIAWDCGDKSGLLRQISRILAGLLVLSAAVLAGAWILGIPVLSALYATDLSDLKAELMLILIGGIFLALNGFLCALLTITRAQHGIPLVYLAGTLLSLVTMNRMVRAQGIRGAVIAFVMTMIFVTVLLTGMFVWTFRHKELQRRPIG